MAMTIACPTCERRIKVPEKMAGRQAKCPACNSAFIVPTLDDVPAGPDPFPVGAPAPAARPGVGADLDFSSFPPAPGPVVAPPLPVRKPFGDPGEEDEAPRPPAAPGSGTFADYLLFRKMVTPVVIQVFFWVGVTLMLLTGLLEVLAAVTTVGTSNPLLFALTLLVALLTVTVGPLLVRIFCEVLILFFRTHETLVQIKDRLEARPGGVEPEASATVNDIPRG